MAKFNAINSKIADVAQLRFFPMPSKPTPAAKVMRFGETTVVIGVNGRIYTTQAQSHCCWQSSERMSHTVHTLITMRMLSPEAVAQHNAAEKDEKAARNARYAATNILDSVEAAGIKLTAAQLCKLEKAREVQR
jgi:exosome complex RNA-binding protein Rrp4